ncbi:hypothetical protein ADK86_07340 [Streptomyces sp. NRRL F-5755]|nr:hypothetical protein ADK86_07340 [Streptomyces sp. NRRL F-5755]
MGVVRLQYGLGGPPAVGDLVAGRPGPGADRSEVFRGPPACGRGRLAHALRGRAGGLAVLRLAQCLTGVGQLGLQPADLGLGRRDGLFGGPALSKVGQGGAGPGG